MVAVAILWERLVERTRRDDRGASLVEYALLVSLIAIVCFVAIVVLGGSVSTTFSTSASSVIAAG
jgi:pilus assembly protein Flp/PilA